MLFTEATSVFSDPLARIFPDETYSGNEVREIIIGHSTAKHLWPVFREQWIVSASAIMKNISQSRIKAKREHGLRAKYRFDYTKSKPNRFAKRIQPGAVAVLLDPDVARVFDSAETACFAPSRRGCRVVARRRLGSLNKTCARTRSRTVIFRPQTSRKS